MAGQQQQPRQDTPLQPTWNGFLASTWDALILLEEVLSGRLHHVSRRPHEKERTDLIRSGSVFVYNEETSGIKRWTDGNHWSPSRIQNNYLIYREMDKPFTPGEKKRALKKKDASSRARAHANGSSPGIPEVSANEEANYGMTEEDLRNFVGSLTDSYCFKAGGLMKKTISIQCKGVQHHIVSYYSIEDAKHRVLPTPSEIYQGLVPRRDLLQNQSFRFPLEQEGSLWHLPQQAPQFLHAGQQTSHYHQGFPGAPYQGDPYQGGIATYQSALHTGYHQQVAQAAPAVDLHQQPWAQTSYSFGSMDNHPIHPAVRDEEFYPAPDVQPSYMAQVGMGPFDPRMGTHLYGEEDEDKAPAY